ncbi:Tubby-like F-box protein 3 [Camellia lanceoleosa]|uniref:Tubby-like F-box protein 3 n=1 Tax=Camellia lanceoleosa TaxID=1840588 RepID=A0ACC0HVD9_9ERIC|nr:Tubby-like F-box protein 3 [Camellia lanceoleosa]
MQTNQPQTPPRQSITSSFAAKTERPCSKLRCGRWDLRATKSRQARVPMAYLFITAFGFVRLWRNFPIDKLFDVKTEKESIKMSFKSIIQDMKGELGSISRKGFDVKFGYGLKSRSLWVVQDSSVVVVDALKQSRWANMPPKLLRDVLIRIEASEFTWPPRKNVVACVGV